MTLLRFTDVQQAPLIDLSLELGAGMHLAVGRPSDGTASLIELAAGLRKARSGRVELDQRQPYYSPELRARIGSLLPEPRLPAAHSVLDHAARTLKLRGSPTAPAALLASWQLEGLGARSTTALSHDEVRSLSLALALDTPRAALLCLYQPFDTLLPRDRVVAKIRAAVEAGATALIALDRSDFADLVPARVFVLERGRLLRVMHAATALDLASSSAPTLLVVCDRIRPLSRILSEDSRISSLTWDETSTPTALKLRTNDRAEASRAVVEAALQAGVEISYLGSEPLSLLELQSAAYSMLGAGERRSEPQTS